MILPWGPGQPKRASVATLPAIWYNYHNGRVESDRWEEREASALDGAKMKLRQKTTKRTGADTVTSGSGNVFADLGFPPREAAELKVKADLTLQIHQRIKELGLTQARAADRLGLSQPDVSKLMAGRHSGFSVERMLSLLSALEVDVDIVVRPKTSGRKFRLGTVRVMDAAHA
jgi:predicted XRE-type DNA-binding protein